MIIRNSFPFSYIYFLSGFAFFTLISKAISEANNTETDVYSQCKVLLIFSKDLIIPYIDTHEMKQKKKTDFEINSFNKPVINEWVYDTFV